MADRVQRHIDLPCDPEQLWRHMIEGEGLGGWLADEAELDLVVGGEARFRDGTTVRTGWVEEVSPPQGDERPPGTIAGRLAFWWSIEAQPASRVELTLVALEPGCTRLEVVETRPLELLDLVGTPLPGASGREYGPALSAV